MFFISLTWLIVLDMLRICVRHLNNKPVPPLSESPHQTTKKEEAWQKN